MRFQLMVIGLIALLVAAPAQPATRAAAPVLPQGYKLPKGVTLPAPTTLGIYLPAAAAKEASLLGQTGLWLRPGKAISAGITSAAQSYFTEAFLVEAGKQRPWGLLVALRPKRTLERNTLQISFKYRVFDASGKQLLEGEKSSAGPAGDLVAGAGYRSVASKTMQLVALDIITQLRPDTANFSVSGDMAGIKPDAYVDRENAIATGTGFYINKAGQVVTAAHVVHDCLLTEVAAGEQKYDARVVAASNLLDIAVMDTGAPATNVLPLRLNAELNLGEPVANVGFPLQKILAATPNLTRGNVSSRGALAGSVGQFQFSAPVQPGSSGGPVVSDGGELLGVTVGTLNALAMAERGVLPQNVNFALDARYAAMFMRKHNIAFSEVPPNPKGDIKIGNEAALSTVVRLTCYQ